MKGLFIGYFDMELKNKIIVIGCSGSGKSYFSKRLGKILNYPVYHLDMIFWKENWEHLSKDEMLIEQEKIAKTDKWIIDGNFSSTIEYRFQVAETIIFLDLDESVCFESAKNRSGQKRDDFPSFLTETFDDDFQKYILNYKNDDRKYVLHLMEKYPDRQYIIFKTREETNKFLDQLNDLR